MDDLAVPVLWKPPYVSSQGLTFQLMIIVWIYSTIKNFETANQRRFYTRLSYIITNFVHVSPFVDNEFKKIPSPSLLAKCQLRSISKKYTHIFPSLSHMFPLIFTMTSRPKRQRFSGRGCFPAGRALAATPPARAAPANPPVMGMSHGRRLVFTSGLYI